MGKEQQIKIDFSNLLKGYQVSHTFAPERITTTYGATKTGKTFASAIWLLYQTLANKNCLSWWLSYTARNAEDSFNTICAVLRNSGIPQKYYNLINSVGSQSITFINGSKIEFKTTQNREALWGFGIDFIVGDEASRWADDILEVLYSVTFATKGKIRLIANMTSKNSWYYDYYQKVKQGLIPDSKAFWITCYDAAKIGIVTLEQIEQIKASLPLWKFNRDYLNIAPEDDSNLFTADDINNIIKIIEPDKTCYFGIDIARGKTSDADYTSIIGIDNKGIITEIHRIKGNFKLQIAKIKGIINTTPTLIEINSYGSVLYDMLQDDYPNLKPFTTTTTSKKSLIEEVLISAIYQQSITINPKINNSDVLIDELKQYGYEETKSGNYTYNAAQGHDDTVISLALATKLYKDKATDLPLDYYLNYDYSSIDKKIKDEIYYDSLVDDRLWTKI